MAVLDTDMVRLAFKKAKDDDARLAELARKLIPRLCAELDNARIDVVKALRKSPRVS